MQMMKNNAKLSILLIMLLLMFQPLSAKRIYSANDLKISKNWVLEFKEGPKLAFTGVGGGRIAFTWVNGNSSPWLFETPQTISVKNFTEIKTKGLQGMIDAVYNVKLTKWQRDKNKYDKKEKDRFEQENKRFNKKKTAFDQRLEREYQQVLTKWEVDKKKFAIKAQKEFEKRSERWEKDRIEFEKKEETRIAREIEKQKELYDDSVEDWEERKSDYEKELKDYEADYDKYSENRKERQENINKCVQKGTSRNKCKVEYPMSKRPKKPRFTEPKPVFAQQPVPGKTFPKPEPVLAKFSDPEPVKSNKTFPDPVPRPARKYGIRMPQPDISPAYGVTGLILHLSKTKCEQGNFILKKQNSIAYIKTVAEKIPGFSPWEGHQSMTKCRVIGREHYAQDSFFSVLIDRGNRPVEIHFSTSAPLHLKQITHPGLNSFKRELIKKAFKVRDIDEFTKSNNRMNYDPIKARYFIEEEGKWAFLTYEVVGKNKQKGIKKLEMDIPQYLIDSSQQDKSFRIKRISLVDRMRKGKNIYLELKRNYWYPTNGDQKDWRFKADYKFGLVRQDKLRNIVKIVSKDDQNIRTEKEINSAGVVYDYTALWYLLPWLQRTKATEMKFTYFDDTRVFGRLLKRVERKMVSFFDSYEKSQKEIEVDRWILEDSKNNEQLAQFLVGTRDRVIYQAMVGGKRFELQTIDTNRILQNRKWKQQQMQQHSIVVLKSP